MYIHTPHTHFRAPTRYFGAVSFFPCTTCVLRPAILPPMMTDWYGTYTPGTKVCHPPTQIIMSLMETSFHPEDVMNDNQQDDNTNTNTTHKRLSTSTAAPSSALEGVSPKRMRRRGSRNVFERPSPLNPSTASPGRTPLDHVVGMDDDDVMTDNNYNNHNNNKKDCPTRLHQQIMEEWVQGPGGLLQDDQQLLFGGPSTGSPTTSTNTLSSSCSAATPTTIPPLWWLQQYPHAEQQQSWLDHVRFARSRAHAWDVTHYTQERRMMHAWLSSKNNHACQGVHK